MNHFKLLGLVISLMLSSVVYADDFLQRYEGDVLPFDLAAGWDVFNPCENECSELLDSGHFILQWDDGNDTVNYSFNISLPPQDVRPSSLWVEWRFRSNNPWPQIGFTCDASFFVQWAGIGEVVHLFSDTAFSFGGDYFIQGLDPNQFHTYRFESVDGTNYRVSVDGIVFIDQPNDPGGNATFIQFRGEGKCSSTNVPVVLNEWDFVRSGTVSFGETIVATDPPTGFVNPLEYPNLDRFVVTFDAANYAYPEDITIGVTGGNIPLITKTRRRDNDEPTNLEVVLTRPLPLGETTTFTFNDGQVANEVAFTYGCPNPADNIDPDNDGIANCMDDCPLDPNKSVPGQCGCGNSDVDTDSDGTSDCNDSCPTDPNKTDPGQCGCGRPEDNVGDSDGDTVADCVDQCPGGDDTIDLNGNNTPDCAEAIPAVSTWGLVILTLLLLTLAKCAPRFKQAADGGQ